ncbi:hypothetical protein DAPPUDRAFT_117982 [Daphnia pulex]|uniref:PWWP domain-containing protein n=1 Tax=Daphnia pulex TaxID=6669 RepID=E9HUC0_DAPPU|nr:hypothetical protein DAPPUDRAFT_117982 [Daphnia pulex]|eukprot:EFX64662.1 hypothetical protein DAPPUDRAFT_117982 [Daphnia pulex]
MANNKIGSNSSRKSEGKSAGNGSEVAEPKRTLASRKFIRLGTIVWAKLDGWPWWPARQHLVTTSVVDRIKAGTLDMDYFCLGCHVGIMAPCKEHPLFFGSLYAIANARWIVPSVVPKETIWSAKLLLVGDGSMSVIMQKTRLFSLALPLRQFHHQNNPTASFSLAPTGKLLPPRFIPNYPSTSDQKRATCSSRRRTPRQPRSRELNTPLIPCDLNWISIGPTTDGTKCTNSTALNSVEFAAVLKNANQMKDEEWAKLCPVPVHLLVLASQPRNSIPSVTNPPAEKWVELRRQFSEGEYEEAFSMSRIASNVTTRKRHSCGPKRMSPVTT